MSRPNKRKRPGVPSQDTFTFTAAQIAQSSQTGARVVVQHADGPRVVRETAVVTVAEPMPAPEVPSGPQRDFQDIHALLGDSDDIIELQNSEEVIHHVLKGGWSIGKPEEHDYWFEEASVCRKSSFPLVPVPDS